METIKINKVVLVLMAFVICVSMVVGSGVLSVSASPKPSKVSYFSAKQKSEKEVSLSWGKAKYASKYEIWRTDYDGSEYKLIKTTSGLSYTDKGVKLGFGYKYKVRGINKAKGSWSDVKRVWMFVDTPTVKVLDKGKTWVKLGFSEKGAVGFDVNLRYCTKNNYYTIKDLKSGKTYKFAVRALEGGTKTKPGASKPVIVTCKTR